MFQRPRQARHETVPRLRLAMLGPAFVAGIAYVDPGNVATNTAAGAQYGYTLIWVVVGANLMAVVVQYLSAKLGIATGLSLPQMCRRQYSPTRTRLLWLQAELVAVATDLAEVLGGSVALYLLFDVPLLVGGLITAAVSFAVLALQTPSRQRRFEQVIIFLLLVIVAGFGWSVLVAGPDPGSTAAGLRPAFEGAGSVLLATGMLGATVMPHAIYLHSALIPDRFGPSRSTADRRTRLRATRVDILLALSIAGAVNISMVLAAAATFPGLEVSTLEMAHAQFRDILGPATATMFALGLLASGFAATSVGTYAGAVILQGFLGRTVPLLVRRLVTLVPAVAILAAGVEPTDALVLSQVVLSFGIPFALFPLVRFTSNTDVMGRFANARATVVCGYAVALVVSALNLAMLGLTIGPLIS